MTSPELHALVDIVMDARERGTEIEMGGNMTVDFPNQEHIFQNYQYPTFSDFTQAVKEYIKTLETK